MPPCRMRECRQGWHADLVSTVREYLQETAENGKITVLSSADPAIVARLSGWMGYFIAGFCRGFQKLGAPCSYEGQLMTVALLQNQQQALGRDAEYLWAP